jgi:hypothetical protein
MTTTTNKSVAPLNPIQILIAFLFAVGCLAYIYGVYKASFLSLQHPSRAAEMPGFLSSVITSIGAVLATNLGAVLGIAITVPKSVFNKKALLNPFSVFAESAATAVQIIACYVYILTLVAAAIVWARLDFTVDVKTVVSTIPEMTKTLLGVIAGVFAVILAKQK